MCIGSLLYNVEVDSSPQYNLPKRNDKLMDVQTSKF